MKCIWFWLEKNNSSNQIITIKQLEKYRYMTGIERQETRVQNKQQQQEKESTNKHNTHGFRRQPIDNKTKIFQFEKGLQRSDDFYR